MTKHAVIIGAGFGGVRAALDLARHAYADLKITIIDKKAYHSYTADYYEVAAAHLPENHALTIDQFGALYSTTAIPIKDIFRKHDIVTFVTDTVSNIIFDQNKIETQSGMLHEYDWLIIALGSQTNFFDIPHLKERSHELKTADDALNIRNAIDELFLRTPKHKKINIVIGGGGFTGCELAAELAGYIKKLASIHAHPTDGVEIIIVEGSGTVLGGASKWVQKKALQRLKKLDVAVFLNKRINDIHDHNLVLKDGDTIPYDLLIWTAGVRANQITGDMAGLKIEKGGCLATDAYLRLAGYSNVFAIGDIAYCFDPRKDSPLPMTAQVAIHQARYVAYTIKRLLHKRRIFTYIPCNVKFIIPLGGAYALADFGWLKFSGFFAWKLRRFIALQYLVSILPWGYALTFWWKSNKIFRKND